MTGPKNNNAKADQGRDKNMATRNQLKAATPTNQRLGISIDEACGKLGISPITLRRAIWEGKLAHFRVGRAVRIRPQDLESWVNSLVQGGPEK